jgi:putative SOS response-associated peptidase YedK
VPTWAKNLSFGAKTFNARVETVAEKPSFRSAFTRQHLIVPVDGYYEWATLGDDQKQPYFITRTDGQPLLLAGLWEQWRARNSGDEHSPLVRSCTILTRPANGDVGHLHDRMPVVVEPPRIDEWLTSLGHESTPMLQQLLNADLGILTARRVGKAVGSVRHDGPELIDEVPLH